MISAQNIYKLYGKQIILNDVSLNIDKNEFVFLVGPNGAGKSTLLQIFYRAILPEKGCVYINDVNICTLKQKQLPLLRRMIGVIFQDYKLFRHKTVYENIAFALEVLGKDQKTIRKQVVQVLELVDMVRKIDYLPYRLSGGEQQKASIARALVNNPPILLADEPTGNLDPDASWEVMQLLGKINEQRKTTVVVATHDKSIVDTMRKRVIEMNLGKILRDQPLGVYSSV